MNYIFKGVATALTTPFYNGKIDFEQFEKKIDRQLKAKVDALVFLGTTGESSTIDRSERRKIIKFAKRLLKGKIPIIVGTGSNCTSTACEMTSEAKELGADGALIVTPYYNLCEQHGLTLHYKEISSNCKFPFITYNVPKRTGVNVLPTTANEILSYDYAMGIKEANGDVAHVESLFYETQNAYPIYCGNDNLTSLFLKHNCTGTISVASNIIPCKIKEFISNFEIDYEKHNRDFNLFYDKIFTLLSSKINPIPIKCLEEILYDYKCQFRLPLNRPSNEYFEFLKSEISKLNLQKDELC
ncbi:MAG: 4-hydroxy-tetrahydrodipicolinate synthase [Clostridia bacterium]|nr:4-hydroxy-tetrahydrodipicolinate synthase [Clostridia bacterium]